jgi:hypothetical protein
MCEVYKTRDNDTSYTVVVYGGDKFVVYNSEDNGKLKDVIVEDTFLEFFKGGKSYKLKKSDYDEDSEDEDSEDEDSEDEDSEDEDESGDYGYNLLFRVKPKPDEEGFYYVFIGCNVIRFKSYDKITGYYSQYYLDMEPFAIDNTKNDYLINYDGVCVLKPRKGIGHILDSFFTEDADPYKYRYNFEHIENISDFARKMKLKNNPKVSKFEDIENFGYNDVKNNNQSKIIKFDSFMDYYEVKNRFKTETFFITKEDGTKIQLNEELYEDLRNCINRFASVDKIDYDLIA